MGGTDCRAPVFDVQSFSIHDGPGIRTTIFFKGCPLNCIWCHNPESKKAAPQLMFHRNLCTGCFLCIGACAYGVHSILLDGKHGVNFAACTGCGKCLEVCCYEALTITGALYSAEDLREKISGDIRYFALTEGAGGVSFSGGEPLLYADAIAAFCRLMPDLHTVLETSGYGTREALEKLLDYIDLYLFDIKIVNGAKHKKWCGVDNAPILENLDFLYAEKKDIVLRLPLIPGINDDEEQFDGVAGLLRKYPEIRRAEILPYHNYGIGKAESLGLGIPPELPAAGAKPELTEKWLDAFRVRGCRQVYLS
ncbi:pyruvate formate lyase-activating protein [Spirochaetia bacterium]|nr:pyruvate formate lyase-activating protein [Spirochaetia bacterium]